MKYIYQQHNWTDFKWNSEVISAMVEKVSRKIGHLNGRLSSIGFNAQMQATVESVSMDIIASSEIEGISLNTQEVRSSVARKLGIKIKDEKEPTHYIEGIVSMMMDAIINHDKPLTEDRLFGWHAALFPTGYSGYEKINVAQYRKDPMKVISGTFGRERVHYEAPKAEDVPDEMTKFIEWVNNPAFPPSLIKSAIAHLWFVVIHPFDDGNGRIARAIGDMLLSQSDDSKVRCFSMSMEINKEKKQYYRILEQTTCTDNSDITEWIKWYLECMERSITESEALLSGVLCKSVFWRTHVGVALSERQQKGLNIYLDGYEGKLTTKNWARLLEISTDTAGRDIKDLVEKNILRPVQGRVRDVAYNLVYTREELLLATLSDIAIIDSSATHWISAIHHGQEHIQERITDLDFQRMEQGEMTLEDIACKYFAYLSD